MALPTPFPAWLANTPPLQTGHADPRRTPCLRVAFYRDTRPVGYHPPNPTGRIITLFCNEAEYNTRMLTSPVLRPDDWLRKYA